MKRIDIITMGCSKNLVDSERLIHRLRAKGYSVEHNSHDVCGDIVVVNTCGFIADAKTESIEMILDLAAAKAEGKIGKIYVMGCLAERYRKELPAELPEVDRWYGKFDWAKLVDELEDLTVSRPTPRAWERDLTTPPYSAYVKIAEGCNRFCAFCAIPLITGRYTSRPIAEILEETRSLVARGTKEFNIIAQDLSAYGSDFTEYHGTRSPLAELIDSMAAIPGVEWIRLHYAYPVDFPWDVLEVMRRRDNVCNYLDIALQHISTPVLANMRRHIDREGTLNLIKRLRAEVPDIRIRTTLMVGFPGEGEREFQELLAFVREVRFDRMGAFAYCEEEDTYAATHFKDTIPEEVKQTRLDTLMATQEEISGELHNKLIGKTLRVLIEGNEATPEGQMAVGRTQWDSPEVDPVVLIPTDGQLTPGEFVEVEITDASPFELTGRLSTHGKR